MRDELLALVADVRATLEAEMARGVVTEAPFELPPPAEPIEAPPVVAAPKLVAPGSAWGAIAEESRRQQAEAVEAGAEGLKRVREELGDCRRCGLCKERRSIVFGVGDPEADLVIVGEGPGHDEDLSGEPFVGPAGQMLDKMLENVVGVKRERVYIANIVKCRPPGNRNPLPDEVAACRPFLVRQIEAIRPKLILILGTVALKSLIDTNGDGIMKLRGRWLEWNRIPVMPTFHPAYLLRNPADKRKTFDDLKVLKARYDEIGGRR